MNVIGMAFGPEMKVEANHSGVRSFPFDQINQAIASQHDVDCVKVVLTLK